MDLENTILRIFKVSSGYSSAISVSSLVNITPATPKNQIKI